MLQTFCRVFRYTFEIIFRKFFALCHKLAHNPVDERNKRNKKKKVSQKEDKLSSLYMAHTRDPAKIAKPTGF